MYLASSFLPAACQFIDFVVTIYSDAMIDKEAMQMNILYSVGVNARCSDSSLPV